VRCTTFQTYEFSRDIAHILNAVVNILSGVDDCILNYSLVFFKGTSNVRSFFSSNPALNDTVLAHRGWGNWYNWFHEIVHSMCTRRRLPCAAMCVHEIYRLLSNCFYNCLYLDPCNCLDSRLVGSSERMKVLILL